MEEHIKESYLKEQKNPFYILLTLYQGNYGRFALSSLFFVIKHLPSWLMPIAHCERDQCSNIKRYYTDPYNLCKCSIYVFTDSAKYFDQLLSCQIS